MRIIVVGDGKVGSTLAGQLSGEGHDVVIIDTNQKVIDESVNQMDIIGICGNGANHKVLIEAEVDKADLLIASASSDELNMLCCLLAKKMGAQNTIARIRNPEYNDQLLYMQKELGLSMSINPEFAAASEMFRILRFPAAIKIEDFSGGRVELAEIIVPSGSGLDGILLRNLRNKYKTKVLVCVVQRENDVFIPNGNFELKGGDIISVTASPAEISRFFASLGILRRSVENVMLIGGGRIAYYLSRMLLNIGVKVKIIETDKERCIELSESLPKAMIINGDGTDQELLLEEGIERMDAFAMLTGFDEQNIILSIYAQSKGVGKVLTKVSRPSMIDLINNTGRELSVISPRNISANTITRYVRAMQNSRGSNVETLHTLVGGRVEALEFRVKDTFEYLNIPLKDLSFKPNLLITSIIRGRQTIVPGGDDFFKSGDSVIAVTDVESRTEVIDDLSDILDKR